ncbi:MAG: serine/threonine protein kinase [Polyangiaceae bacterium]|nr:serine/threonine protein kinase [Polyangiaceae bacterium]
MTTEVELRARARITALELDRAALRPDVTLKPHTVALAEWQLGSAPTAALATDGTEPVLPSVEPLPRISLGPLADAVVDPDTTNPHAPDLTLVRTLGEGGMGAVHLARQRSLDREVAVKGLKPGATARIAEALVHEARATGALEHPGVIPVHALGLDDRGWPVLVMKRVDGVEWRVLLEDPEHVLWGERQRAEPLLGNLEILMRVCETVEFAHSRGLLHLDVKPENVMVGAFGEVYLVDWGIARRVGEPQGDGGIVGTPAYMAPEMVLGSALGPHTDVYLLGATLHQVLTGRCRHDGQSLEGVLVAAALSPPVAYPPALPAQLGELANRATARDPAQRPESVRHFRQELAGFVQGRSAHALAAAALSSIDQIEALLAAQSGALTAEQLAAAHRLATEARFGIAQSRREQPSNRPAQQAHERCVRALIELELRQGHADTARALLDELDEPSPALVVAIEKVEATLARRREAEERMRALAKEQDPTVGARGRTLLLAGATIVIASFSSFVLLAGGVVVAAERLVAISATLLALAVAVLILGRKALLASAFNRKLGWLVLVLLSATLLNRVSAMLTGSPVAGVFQTDAMTFAAVTAGGAVLLLPWLWVSALLSGVAFAGTRAWPEHAAPIFGFASTLNVLIILLVLRQRVRTHTGEADA